MAKSLQSHSVSAAIFSMVVLLAMASVPHLGMAQDVQPKAAMPADTKQADTKPADTKQSPSSRSGATQTSDQRSGDVGARTSASAARQLPPDVTTEHTLELPGRLLKFKGTAGSIPLTGEDGRLQAEMGYIAFQLAGADPLTRPVTFAFNGGPGSASAWVNIGGFGPWRLPISGTAVAPSAPPLLLPNAETWLDFTDLVFIDPVGTGYSRLARPSGEAGAAPSGDGNRTTGGARYFYSVNGDVESVADMITKWLRQNNRLASPKMLAGESYGGIRAPKVVHTLQTSHGVGMNAVVLVSPVMDYASFRGARHRMGQFVHTLPTIAAAAREAKGEPFKSRDDLAIVEAYARSEYVVDFLRGPRDTAALDRMVKRVAAFADLPEAIVRQYGAKLDEFIYTREANRAKGKTASGYDASVTGDDPDPTVYFPRWDDPFATALNAPMRGAMSDLYGRLGWKTDLTYHMLSTEVNRGWQWGNSTDGVESLTQLKSALALDPNLRVLVTHGATDLRTPYFGSVLALEQLPTYAGVPMGRVSLMLFAGGHMHYSRDASRIGLRDAVKALLTEATAKAPR
jgi:carboxypeptidase C (cathepsin A)